LATADRWPAPGSTGERIGDCPTNKDAYTHLNSQEELARILEESFKNPLP
jgi:hypothetical protein